MLPVLTIPNLGHPNFCQNWPPDVFDYWEFPKSTFHKVFKLVFHGPFPFSIFSVHLCADFYLPNLARRAWLDVCPTFATRRARRLPPDGPNVCPPMPPDTCPTSASLPKMQKVETPDFSQTQALTMKSEGFCFCETKIPKKTCENWHFKTQQKESEARCGVQTGPRKHPRWLGGVSNYVVVLRLGGCHLNMRVCCQSFEPLPFQRYSNNTSNCNWIVQMLLFCHSTDSLYNARAGRLPTPASPPIQMTQLKKRFAHLSSRRPQIPEICCNEKYLTFESPSVDCLNPVKKGWEKTKKNTGSRN